MSVHLAGHLSALWGRWLSASRLDGPPVRGAASGERLRGTARLLELCLARNIVPFWYPRVVDATAGGYRLHHDSRGRWLGPSTKGIVAQARTLWFFSRLARSDYGRAEHRRAASHGYRFLRERMWDERCGGFFWEVGADGAAATRTDKVLLGQAFGLYALSEYALATGDASAADLAHALFRRIEEARDPARDFYP